MKTLAVPVIDALRPVRAERMSGRGRTDRVITDLHPAFMMRGDLSPQLLRQHLGAQSNAQKRPVLAQGNFDPVDFAANIGVGIVGTHRATKNDRAGVLIERLRQRVADPRAPDITSVTHSWHYLAATTLCL